MTEMLDSSDVLEDLDGEEAHEGAAPGERLSHMYLLHDSGEETGKSSQVHVNRSDEIDKGRSSRSFLFSAEVVISSHGHVKCLHPMDTFRQSTCAHAWDVKRLLGLYEINRSQEMEKNSKPISQLPRPVKNCPYLGRRHPWHPFTEKEKIRHANGQLCVRDFPDDAVPKPYCTCHPSDSNCEWCKPRMKCSCGANWSTTPIPHGGLKLRIHCSNGAPAL
jgi:hypothetical protein